MPKEFSVKPRSPGRVAKTFACEIEPESTNLSTVEKPAPSRMEPVGFSSTVNETSTWSGLSATGGGELEGFAIAGDDGKFVWAEAKIAGNTVEVSSPQVKQPVAVRYAWADNPRGNLTNDSGLPASPFRSDP